MCTTRLALLGLLQITELGLGLRFTLYLLSKMEVLIARIGTKNAVTHRKKGHKKSFTQGSVPEQTLQIQSVFGSTLKFKIFTLFLN
jgi:hypothetical protein